MFDFLTEQLPTDPIKKVHAFARDLAYWVTKNEVGPVFSERLSSCEKKYLVLPIEKKVKPNILEINSCKISAI